MSQKSNANASPSSTPLASPNASVADYKNELPAGLLKSLWNSSHLLAEVSKDGHILQANDEFKRQFQLPEKPEEWGSLSDLVPAKDVTSLPLTELWERAQAHGSVTGLWTYRTSQGAKLWLDTTVTHVEEDGVEGGRLIFCGVDQSAERRAELVKDGTLRALNRVQGIIEFNPDGTIVNANENFLSLVEYSLKELVGQHHQVFCDPSYVHSQAYREFWGRLRSGEFHAGEFKRYAKGNREVWIHASYNPVFDDTGKVVRIIKFASDITETKRRSMSTQSTLHALDRVQAIIEFSLDGTIRRANQNFLAVMGYSAEEIVGKHHRLFCDEVWTKSPEYEQFWSHLRSGHYLQGEYRRIAKGGREVWIQASYNPVLDEKGVPIGVIKFATDVTAAKLQAVETKAKIAAIDRAQAVIEFSMEGNVTAANDNFLELMGYTEREVVGKHHRKFCSEDEIKQPEYRAFWARMGRGEFNSGRYRRRTKLGTDVWIQATYNPILDPQGKPYKVVKCAVDVTDQVEREHDILCKAEAMDRTLSQMTQSISAILNTCAEATQMAQTTQEEAQRGNQSVGQSLEAMNTIEQSSREICETIRLIEELSSQTNVLAFNAAIEAARAGTQGLGFTVVADEVRKLAERSTTAAKEINKLVQEAVRRITFGSQISVKAREAFESILAGVQKTSKALENIHKSTEAQTSATRHASELVRELTRGSRSVVEGRLERSPKPEAAWNDTTKAA